MFFENVTAKYYGLDNGGNVGSNSWGLPKPRTRKEYYLAILAGGTPGEDFPDRSTSEETEVSESSTATLDNNYSGSGYRYYVTLNEIGSDINSILSSDNGKVYLNTTDITNSCSINYNDRQSNWQLSVILESTLSSTSVIIKGIYAVKNMLLPKTIEEEFFAFNASDIYDGRRIDPIDMLPKTRKDKYFRARLHMYQDDLPLPKTRLEYFLAMANKLVPGEDFPDRSTIETESEEHDNVDILIDKGYSGEKYGYCFHYSEAGFEHEWAEGDVMLVNGVDVSASVQFDDIACSFEFDTPLHDEISLDAYADIAVQWSESIPPLPKTMYEALFAAMAQIDISNIYTKFKAKTRQDKYIKAVLDHMFS